jgi:ABC-type multidrug transport system fused ATPase/permease subunit
VTAKFKTEIPTVNPKVFEYDSNIARRLFRFLSTHRLRMALGVILMCTSVFDAVFGPAIIGRAVDDGLATGNLALMFSLVLLYLGITFISQTSAKFQIATMVRMGQTVIRDIRQILYEHVQILSIGFFARYEVGRLISRIIGDVQMMREFLIFSVLAITRDVVIVVGIVLVMLTTNLPLTVVILLVMPVLFFFALKWSAKSRQIYTSVREEVASVNGRLAEDFNGVRVVQAFARENYNYNRFHEKDNKEVLRMNLNAAFILAIFFPLLELLSGLTLFGLVLVGGLLVLNNGLTAGILVAFVLYIEQLYNPIRDLAQRWTIVQVALASGEQVFQVLDEPVEITDKPGAIEIPRGNGRVEFADVSFGYNPGQLVLHNINLSVQPGQRVAFVGDTGAGKSSIIKLLLRFYDVTSGVVKVDGYDIRDITQHSLRNQMGIVLQETHLFSETIMNNIRSGRDTATDEEVIAAAKAVGADDFIKQVPEGYQTKIQKGASIFSVGQRQLLAFARALVANPPILILDEATSNIDTHTEKLIQQAISTLLTNRTSFMIAHRLSTITTADIIVVMDHGRIVEQGNHAQLLAQRGRYHALYTMAYKGETTSADAEIVM